MKTGAGTRKAEWWLAAASVAAVYVYFLLFPEFALLDLAADRGGVGLRETMGFLGVGGITGSVLAAAGYRRERWHLFLSSSLVGAAAAAGIVVWQATATTLVIAALVSGLALGMATVTLVTGLLAASGGVQLGLCVGLGTGSAYAFCNLPWVFEATARTQSATAAVVALVGAILVWRLPRAQRAGPERARASAGAFFLLTGVLAILVALDSSAFYVIQHTNFLKQAMWSGDIALLRNASVHLLAAVIAGIMLDRKAAPLVLLAAALALCTACALARESGYAAAATALYVTGVSFYSTALVFLPAQGARPWISCVCYGVAGWIGSALGLGAAQHLNGIPLGLAFGALGLVALILGAGRRKRLAVLGVFGIVQIGHAQSSEPSVQVGRRVYQQEGCINCHSQFIRSGVSSEVTAWGPAKPLAESLREEPPLYGNRRQGPDLSAVGNRRSEEWQVLHLSAPQDLLPGSRMPSYQRLFRGEAVRGRALVAYLRSLGAGTQVERREMIAEWRPRLEASKDASVDRGQRLFAIWCSACHGKSGRGDGPVVTRLSLHPPDWATQPWRHLAAGEAEPDVALARLVKFGVLETPMAGHEYFDDSEVMALVKYVRFLHAAHP